MSKRAYYKHVQELLHQWKIDNNYTCKCVVHHRNDTEECRKYNEEHYELWGHNLDGTFEYGKYVVFMTHAEHSSYHNKVRHIDNKGENNPMYGKHHSEAAKQKMRNRVVSPETRSKMSLNHANVAGENNPFYGKKHSNETLSLMAERRNTISNSYSRYKEAGGQLKWKAFMHAVKIGEINI